MGNTLGISLEDTTHCLNKIVQHVALITRVMVYLKCAFASVWVPSDFGDTMGPVATGEAL